MGKLKTVLAKSHLLFDVDLPVPPRRREEGDQPLEGLPRVVNPLGLRILDDQGPRLQVVGVLLDLPLAATQPLRVQSLKNKTKIGLDNLEKQYPTWRLIRKKHTGHKASFAWGLGAFFV